MSSYDSKKQKIEAIANTLGKHGTRAYMFTIHSKKDPKKLDLLTKKLIASTKDKSVKYLEFQHEKGEKTGTRHIQCGIYFKNCKTKSAFVKWMWNNVTQEFHEDAAQPIVLNGGIKYQFKEETALPDTHFLYGKRPKDIEAENYETMQEIKAKTKTKEESSEEEDGSDQASQSEASAGEEGDETEPSEEEILEKEKDLFDKKFKLDKRIDKIRKTTVEPEADYKASMSLEQELEQIQFLKFKKQCFPKCETCRFAFQTSSSIEDTGLEARHGYRTIKKYLLKQEQKILTLVAGGLLVDMSYHEKFVTGTPTYQRFVSEFGKTHHEFISNLFNLVSDLSEEQKHLSLHSPQDDFNTFSDSRIGRKIYKDSWEDTDPLNDPTYLDDNERMVIKFLLFKAKDRGFSCKYMNLTHYLQDYFLPTKSEWKEEVHRQLYDVDEVREYNDNLIASQPAQQSLSDLLFAEDKLKKLKLLKKNAEQPSIPTPTYRGSGIPVHHAEQLGLEYRSRPDGTGGDWIDPRAESESKSNT